MEIFLVIFMNAVLENGYVKLKSAWNTSPLFRAGTILVAGKIGSNIVAYITGDNSLDTVIDMITPVVAAREATKSINNNVQDQVYNGIAKVAIGGIAGYNVGSELMYHPGGYGTLDGMLQAAKDGYWFVQGGAAGVADAVGLNSVFDTLRTYAGTLGSAVGASVPLVANRLSR